MYLFKLVILMLASQVSIAATVPLQNIVKSQKKYFFKSSLGYSIHSENTLWKLSKTSPKGKVLVYEQPGSVFSIRIKEITEPNIDLHIKNHLSTYKHFGLIVTKTKKIKFKNKDAYLIYTNSEKKLYSSQLLTQKNKHLVSMTCTGKKSNQKYWTSQCVKIMKNFNWTD